MTDRYAVFGNPIAHSKSPRIHSLFAEQTKQDIAYTKQLVEIGDFEQAVIKFFDAGGKGCNVTVPFKLDAFEFADKHGTVSESAKLAGAVNTLKEKDGKIFGDNTDGTGLVRDITQNLGWQIKDKRILILGAGGAVRGVLGPLLKEQPSEILIDNRTREKAEKIVMLFKHLGNVSIFVPNKPNPNCDLIINGTSASLTGDKPLLISDMPMAPSAQAYDMVYGRRSGLDDKLPFIKTIDGLGMLVEQAAESFYIWRGVRPETQSVMAIVRGEL